MKDDLKKKFLSKLLCSKPKQAYRSWSKFYILYLISS